MKHDTNTYRTYAKRPESHRGSSPLVLKYRLPRAVAVAMLAAPPMAASAQDSTTEFIEPTTFDQVWGYATLYKDDLNPILQEFKLRGRYHGQYWAGRRRRRSTSTMAAPLTRSTNADPP